MFGIAIMGYGTVGSGVADAVRFNADIIQRRTGVKPEVLRILDILEAPDSPDAAKITHQVEELVNDDRIRTVIETMGGINAAYEFTKKMLNAKKHVVSSNKDVVAEYGPELLALARENGVRYLFEASVGSGTPMIRPLERCLIANNIEEIHGILNGTTNFMLTYMTDCHTDWAQTLIEAQNRGYAEKDPASDVEGYDSARKLAILSSIAYGHFVDWKQIRTKGITRIDAEDVLYAAQMGYTVKLISRSSYRNGTLRASVEPVLLERENMLSKVSGVYNAVIIKGDIVEDVMFYGEGAGKKSTASAIVADLIDIATGGKTGETYCWDRDAALAVSDFTESCSRFYARILTDDRENCIQQILKELPEAVLLPKNEQNPDRSVAFTTDELAETTFHEKMDRVARIIPGTELQAVLKIGL